MPLWGNSPPARPYNISGINWDFRGCVYRCFRVCFSEEVLIGDKSLARRTFILNNLRELIKTKTCQRWLDTLKPYDTSTVRLPHFSEVSRDPQAWENDFIREVTYPTGYTHRVPTSPIEMKEKTG